MIDTTNIKLFIKRIDWTLFLSVILLSCAGLVTMNSFSGENYFFQHQIIWLLIGIFLFFFLSNFDFRFLRKTSVITTLFLVSVFILLILLFFGEIVKGSQSWFDVGFFSIQPSDPIKLVLILVLAKYFSRRHVEIAHYKHIMVSGLYMFVFFTLVFLQSDFGSAIIIFFIWAGMILAAGVSKKHLLFIGLLAVFSMSLLWAFAFEDYQKQRIMTFINPLTDLQGAGYNAYQSTVAVGSGELFGKDIGFGTQSRLQFLPEYETDFIFAAFAEEWGFVGVILLFSLFSVVIWRILASSIYGATNFEILFGIGLTILFMSQFVVHVGMNIGLLPVTGTTIPFLSYGGSHILTEFIGLGIFMGMQKYNRGVHKDDANQEFFGI